MMDIHKLEDFFTDCRVFSKGAYEEGFRVGELECQNMVLNYFQEIDLGFLDEWRSLGMSLSMLQPKPLQLSLLPFILLPSPSLLVLI